MSIPKDQLEKTGSWPTPFSRENGIVYFFLFDHNASLSLGFTGGWEVSVKRGMGAQAC